MNRNPYLPPMRSLVKNKSSNPYVPSSRTTPAEIVPEHATLALDTFVRDIMNVPPRERSSWLASILGERWDLGRRTELVDTRTRLLASVQNLLTRASTLTLTEAKFRIELETAVKRARTELEALERTHEVELAELDAKLAEANQRKRRAENRDDD